MQFLLLRSEELGLSRDSTVQVPLLTWLALHRDDLTVEVIFFGEGEATGDTKANIDASAPGTAKPKL